ncbi:response regulator [Deferribacter thermophilus]|uniref:response regulator n=1 Tax=Deferribacter thermophilus TaxID=53573 RepID=UPI003C18F0A7
MTTILLVDDSKFIQENIKEEIQKKFSDIIIYTADNPIEAEKILEKNIIDLLLLDVKMPIKSGNIFLKELKSISYYSDLPVIMLTSVAEKEIVIELLKLGIDGYIIKDNVNQLTSKIEKFIKEPSELNRLKQFSRVSDFITLRDTWFRTIFDILYDGDYTSLDSETIEKINLALKNINNTVNITDIETDLEMRLLSAVAYIKSIKPLLSWFETSYFDEIIQKVSGLLLALYLYLITNDSNDEDYKFLIEYILTILISAEYCGRLKYDKETLILVLNEKYHLFYKMFVQNCPIKMKNKEDFFKNNKLIETLNYIEYLSKELFPDNSISLSWKGKNDLDIPNTYIELLKEFYKNIQN